MVELAADRGYERITIRGLSKTAGVSSGTFYSHFTNLEHCFAATFQQLLGRALRRATVVGPRRRKDDNVARETLANLLLDFSAHTKEAHLLLFEVYAVGPSMQPRMWRAARSLVGAAVGPEIGGKTTRDLTSAAGAAITRVARTAISSPGTDSLRRSTEELSDWLLASLDESSLLQRLSADIQHFPVTHIGRRSFPLEALSSASDPRARVRAAVVKLAATAGMERITGLTICSNAGISRRTFERLFPSVTSSLLDSAQAIMEFTAAHALKAADRATDDAARTVSMVRDLCGAAAENSRLARLCYLTAPISGREGLAQTDRWISLATAHLTNRTSADLDTRTRVGTEASVAATWRLAQLRIASGRSHEMSGPPDLVGAPARRG
jgi:AcrR family transcriptional regulator